MVDFGGGGGMQALAIPFFSLILRIDKGSHSVLRCTYTFFMILLDI